MVSPAPSGGPELIAFLNALEYLKNRKGQDAFENFTDTSEYLKEMATILKNLEGLQLRLGDLPDAKTENLVHYIMNKDNAAKFVSERQSAGSELVSITCLKNVGPAHTNYWLFFGCLYIFERNALA